MGSGAVLCEPKQTVTKEQSMAPVCFLGLVVVKAMNYYCLFKAVSAKDLGLLDENKYTPAFLYAFINEYNDNFQLSIKLKIRVIILS